ncbi:hypothetical protein JCM9534A_06040 [Catenuloplanes indicus JCM 9534]
MRGRRVGGLLCYRCGPGRWEEHVDPWLVAAWHGAGPLAAVEPAAGPDGPRDFRMLTAVLEQPRPKSAGQAGLALLEPYPSV